MDLWAARELAGVARGASTAAGRAKAVEKAGSAEAADVIAAINAGGIEFQAPEGLVTLDGENHHVFKTARIGQIEASGQITEVWASDGPIEPNPFLAGPDYPWAQDLTG
jgi:urea transport system substrate-binding protein